MASLKQLTAPQPLPFPTLLDLPSTTFLFMTIDQIDDKLSSMNPDVFLMSKFATQIKQSILHSDCNLIQFRQYGLREMGLIHCIYSNFGVCCFYDPKIISCIRLVNSKWKKLLFKNIDTLNKKSQTSDIFQYKTERNTYFLTMLRTFNIKIQKIIQKLQHSHQFNNTIKCYLKQKGIYQNYQNTWNKIEQVICQTQEETILKIQLVNQFLKYLLNFMYVKQEITKECFDRFLKVCIALCRLLKKFYNISTEQQITRGINTIKEGITVFMQLEISGIELSKIQQLKMIISMLENRRVSIGLARQPNKNAFVLRLLLKILSSWKAVHYREMRKKRVSSSEKTIKPEMDITQAWKINIGKENKIKTRNLSNSNILNSGHKVQRGKSLGVKWFSTNLHSIQSFHQPISNVKIRTEIESLGNRYFERANSLHLQRSISRERKPKLRMRYRQEQKQLRLQEYNSLYGGDKKVIPNLNRIQLYRQDKMQNFYNKKPKTKLKLN